MFARLHTIAVAFLLTVSTAYAEDTYTVKKGNNLTWIAKQRNVSAQSIIFKNEEVLKANYDKRCRHLSDEFRNRSASGGANKGGLHYCNDGKRRPYANTLNPGLTLEIPADTAPASIEQTISEIKGDRIAVVIDETGSTKNKRHLIGEFYLAAIRKKARSITGIYLFAEGGVRRIDAVGVTDLAAVMKNHGGYENTHQALEKAADDKPDAIVLITDEPGDDWNWSTVHRLPPVIAHCLPDRRFVSCEQTLKRLARETHGRYFEGLADSTAKR